MAGAEMIFAPLIPIFGILLVMIPVTGFTVAMVAKTLAKIRREAEGVEASKQLMDRIALLQEEVEALSSEVKELKTAQEFDRKLLQQRSGAERQGA